MVKRNGKAILVTDPGSLQGCETSKFPHFLDSRLTDGGKVASLTRRPPFTPRKILATYFCYRLGRPQGLYEAETIRSIEKSSDLNGDPMTDGNHKRTH
jgi:hypothetical protein